MIDYILFWIAKELTPLLLIFGTIVFFVVGGNVYLWVSGKFDKEDGDE